MSDPVTNVEIEDVLSSIRRLVTEESRGGLRKTVREPEQEPDRLVLTPALRVAGTEAEAPKAEPENEPEIAAEEDPWKTPGARLFDAARDLSEDEVPWYKKGLEADQTSEETAVLETEEVADHIDFFDIPDSAKVPLDLGLHAIDAPTEQVEKAMESDVLHLTKTQQTDAPAIDATHEEHQPETAEADTGEDADLDHVQGDDDHDQLAAKIANDDEDRAPDVVEEDLLIEEPAPEAHEPDGGVDDAQEEPASAEQDVILADYEHRAATLNAKIEALEAAIAETQDQWDPDGESEDDYSGTPVETMAWQDHEPPEETIVPDAHDTLETDTLSGDEAILDEESLRELISDIVREELQGALGERITRNVRKLVRREIHRALTTQDLE